MIWVIMLIAPLLPLFLQRYVNEKMETSRGKVWNLRVPRWARCEMPRFVSMEEKDRGRTGLWRREEGKIRKKTNGEAELL